MKQIQNYNYHTHSTFSDGKSTLAESVEAAISLGFDTIGFSDHCNLPFENTFAIQDGMMEKYISDIQELKKRFKGNINILSSLEMDYIPNVVTGFDETKRKYNLDYAIGSVHIIGNQRNADELWFIDGPDYRIYDAGLVKFFGNDIRRAVKAFFDQSCEMIANEKFDIIGHFDKIKMHNRNRFFTEDEKWYRNHIFEILQLIRERNLIVEINTRGIYKKRSTDFYPATWIMPYMRQMDIPVVLSSDAHHCSELNLCFGEAIKALKAAGYKSVAKLKDGRFTEIEI